MAATTNIEWADATFNPWIGCTNISPACDHCYAEISTAARSTAARLGHPLWGHGAPRHRTSPSTWKGPLQWDAAARAAGRRIRVFCASLADVFDNDVPGAWRRDLMHLIGRTSNIDWMLLTKRIGNAERMLNSAIGDLSHGLNDWSELPWPNVWLGATVVNQEEADRDIPKLLATPARVRFLSIEPMLGSIDLQSIRYRGEWLSAFNTTAWPELGRVDWVICGGESGPHARPMHPDWARSLRDQCAAAGVPYLFKQWGEWVPAGEIGFHGHEHRPVVVMEPHAMMRTGKVIAGRLLDGVTHDGFPVPAHG